MIKRTLCITSPCYLSASKRQLLIKPRDDREPQSVPIEDIGFLILENHSITLSIRLIELLNENNSAVIFCDSRHMPNSMLLPFEGNTTHAETMRSQIEASVPLTKQLWASTIRAKIKNQAGLLKLLKRNESKLLTALVNNVKSGDPDNREGVAARIYWLALMGPDFKRERFGNYPNNLANYGYAVLRGATARALVGSGLHPVIGIHHKNRYNAFALADDIMEPYRPFVDQVVCEFYKNNPVRKEELSPEEKRAILKFLTSDVIFGRIKRPLMTGLSRTTSSFVNSFKQGKALPVFPELK